MMEGTPALSQTERARYEEAKKFLRERGIASDPKTGEISRSTLLQELKRRDWDWHYRPVSKGYEVMIHRIHGESDRGVTGWIEGHTPDTALARALMMAIRDDEASPR
ncbi:MAG: hypothetical protein ACJ8FM_18980 [Xanthobacteraceae bacterium]